MDATTKLTALVTIILALSIASERLVEIVKGIIPFLSKENSNETFEGWRRSLLQLLAVASAIFTAFISSDYIPHGLVELPETFSEKWAILGLGLLASGGSGFWNSVLTYLGKAKDVKKAEAETKKVETDTKKIENNTKQVENETKKVELAKLQATPPAL